MVSCGTPWAFNSVTKSLKPHDITQSPPGSFAALPQQMAVCVRESVICSTSAAVLVEVLMVNRTARGSRLALVPLSCTVIDPSAKRRA
jgi:hypothetical protein